MAASFDFFCACTQPEEPQRTPGDQRTAGDNNPGDAVAGDIDPGDGGDVFRQWNPDFNVKSLRLNMVLRWEYMPGSTFYLVWTRDKANFDDPGSFDLERDLNNLLEPEAHQLRTKIAAELDMELAAHELDREQEEDGREGDPAELVDEYTESMLGGEGEGGAGPLKGAACK